MVALAGVNPLQYGTVMVIARGLGSDTGTQTGAARDLFAIIRSATSSLRDKWGLTPFILPSLRGKADCCDAKYIETSVASTGSIRFPHHFAGEAHLIQRWLIACSARRSLWRCVRGSPIHGQEML